MKTEAQTKMVVALTTGFYGHLRMPGGAAWAIPADEKLGKWMALAPGQTAAKGVKQVEATGSTQPAVIAGPYSAKHHGGGNWVVVKGDDRYGEFIANRDPSDKDAAKNAAAAEAYRLNLFEASPGADSAAAGDGSGLPDA